MQSLLSTLEWHKFLPLNGMTACCDPAIFICQRHVTTQPTSAVALFAFVASTSKGCHQQPAASDPDFYLACISQDGFAPMPAKLSDLTACVVFTTALQNPPLFAVGWGKN